MSKTISIKIIYDYQIVIFCNIDRAYGIFNIIFNFMVLIDISPK